MATELTFKINFFRHRSVVRNKHWNRGIASLLSRSQNSRNIQSRWGNACKTVHHSLEQRYPVSHRGWNKFEKPKHLLTGFLNINRPQILESVIGIGFVPRHLPMNKTETNLKTFLTCMPFIFRQRLLSFNFASVRCFDPILFPNQMIFGQEIFLFSDDLIWWGNGRAASQKHRLVPPIFNSARPGFESDESETAFVAALRISFVARHP